MGKNPLRCVFLILATATMALQGVYALLYKQSLFIESDLIKRQFSLWFFEMLGIELYALMSFGFAAVGVYLLVKCQKRLN